MKSLRLIISIVVVSILLNACDKNYLNKRPLDKVGTKEFFTSPKSLEIYMNQFYNSGNFPIMGSWGLDFNSDNEITINVNSWLRGSRTLDGAGNINFSGVRAVNYFLDNYKNVGETYTIEDYKQYVGEAYFFKALIYFRLLKHYGDIQWLTSVLETNSPELYNPRNPRNVVADNIIACLDTAATYLTADKTDGNSRINKWMALLIQSRVALFEGTWEKYHAGDPFGVTDPQPEKYFKKVVEAAITIMNSGLYAVYSTGNPDADYHSLFTLRDYSDNKEVMFWKSFDNELTKGERPFRNQPNYDKQLPRGHSITKSLADAYLCIDGQPISISSDFEGYTTIEKEATNRDPRFYQTIAVPDNIWHIYEDGTKDYYSKFYSTLINTGGDYRAPSGYVIYKGYDPRVQYQVPQYEETPGVIYRYAEVLLNFAEAKAELGKLTQADINKSIKKLRDRVGMPNLFLGNIQPDPAWNFPSLSPAINEIRRERRVELALEGFRAADIKRWAAADELIVGNRPKGFLASQIPTVNLYPVDGKGFLDPFKNQIPNGYGFQINRDYLDAIPKTQIELNPNLNQNPGWGK